jgi:hypothetical protein
VEASSGDPFPASAADGASPSHGVD